MSIMAVEDSWRYSSGWPRQFLLTIGTRSMILFEPGLHKLELIWIFQPLAEGAESLGVAMKKREGFSCCKPSREMSSGELDIIIMVVLVAENANVEILVFGI